MKLTKFASTAIVAALAMWASSAKATGLFRFEKLNFSLTARQQGLDYSNSAPSTYVSTVKAMKITNKDLLNFLADAFNTNWPAGAQLALEGEEIFVVDKTGTNLLFNASTGINLGGTNIAYFKAKFDGAVLAGKVIEKIPGGQNFTAHQIISFQLYQSVNETVSTDLNFQGLDVSKINEIIISADNETISESDDARVSGDGDFNDTWTVVRGHVTGAGKWKGLPPA